MAGLRAIPVGRPAGLHPEPCNLAAFLQPPSKRAEVMLSIEQITKVASILLEQFGAGVRGEGV